MRLEEELARFSPERDTLLTVGVFDGVHRGHKQLIAELGAQAAQRKLLPVVVTFRQHPQELVSPQSSLPALTSIEERIALLKDAGAELVVPLSFTPEVAQLTARRFVSLLQKHLRMRGLVVGPDFALGKNREGDTETLRKLGQKMDFTVAVLPPMTIDGEVVSSTAIREALAEGNVRKAGKFAGCPFSLHGSVVSGAGRGTGLGFPTANLDTNSHQAVPAEGVYASRARIGGKAYGALTNIGKCPTFGGVERRVEVFILDYKGDLYGQEMKVDFVERLREERRFSNVEELKRQMAEDTSQARVLLAAEGKN